MNCDFFYKPVVTHEAISSHAGLVKKKNLDLLTIKKYSVHHGFLYHKLGLQVKSVSLFKSSSYCKPRKTGDLTFCKLAMTFHINCTRELYVILLARE